MNTFMNGRKFLLSFAAGSLLIMTAGQSVMGQDDAGLVLASVKEERIANVRAHLISVGDNIFQQMGKFAGIDKETIEKESLLNQKIYNKYTFDFIEKMVCNSVKSLNDLERQMSELRDKGFSVVDAFAANLSMIQIVAFCIGQVDQEKIVSGMMQMLKCMCAMDLNEVSEKAIILAMMEKGIALFNDAIVPKFPGLTRMVVDSESLGLACENIVKSFKDQGLSLSSTVKTVKDLDPVDLESSIRFAVLWIVSIAQGIIQKPEATIKHLEQIVQIYKVGMLQAEQLLNANA